MPGWERLFLSSEPESARKERGWLLGLLAAGVREAKDFRLLEKRGCVAVLLAYHQSSVAQAHERLLIRQLLLSLAQLRPAAFELCKRAALPAWLLSQRAVGEEEEEKVDGSLGCILAALWSSLSAEGSELPLLALAALRASAEGLGSREAAAAAVGPCLAEISAAIQACLSDCLR